MSDATYGCRNKLEPGQVWNTSRSYALQTVSVTGDPLRDVVMVVAPGGVVITCADEDAGVDSDSDADSEADTDADADADFDVDTNNSTGMIWLGHDWS